MQPKSPIVVELRNDGGGYYGSGGSEEETTTLTSSSSSSHSSIIGIEGESTTNANDVEQHQNNGSCDEDPVVLDDMDTILMDDDAISYDAELTTPMLIRSNNKAIHRSASAHSGSSCCRRNHHEDGNNNNSSHLQSYATTTAATATATNHNHKKQRVSSCWWWQWLFATGSQGGGAGKDHPKTIKSWFSSSVVATAVFVLCCGLCLFFAVLGLPFPNRQLPSLPPLPHNPQRAFATLHSDSNPCYDMLLYVCLSTWQATHSQYPMLVLHSVPLPGKVQALIDAQQTQQEQNQEQQQAGRIIPVSIPAVNNYFVLKDRVRSASAKFAVWDQTAYDQVAYFDSDTIFFDSGDSIFTSPSDNTGNLWLYARPYPKYWQRGIKIFNSGNFLVRPHAAVYQKIMELFQRRFWILSFQQFLKTADQGFLNAVFSPHGTAWDLLAPPDAELDQVKHVKLWVAMAGLAKYNVTAQVQQGALQLAQDMDLQNDLDECHRHRRFSD
ncbi:hypothetical protein ACA910_008772 [Epithemia clementina (nom. ined.)]